MWPMRMSAMKRKHEKLQNTDEAVYSSKYTVYNKHIRIWGCLERGRASRQYIYCICFDIYCLCQANTYNRVWGLLEDPVDMADEDERDEEEAREVAEHR